MAPAIRHLGLLLLGLLLLPSLCAGVALLPSAAALPEKFKALTSTVSSICLTSSSSPVTFSTGEAIFIGNPASLSPLTPSLCFPLQPQFILQAQQTLSGPLSFSPSPIPAPLTNQAWDVSFWPPAPGALALSQAISLSVSNTGPSTVQLTGIGSSVLSVFGVGVSATLLLNRTQVQLAYQGLGLLTSYLYSANNSLPQGNVTALALIQASSETLITYALVKDTKNDSNPDSRFSFHLFESTLSSSSAGSQRRRLLQATAKNKAPPSACKQGCCVPASPMPKGCAKGASNYPSCSRTCGCDCN